jgi:polyisoprenyl-phosphate glycosyltransferase
MTNRCYKGFLSVIIVERNQATMLREKIARATEELQRVCPDYELIIVDNASRDHSLDVLKSMTQDEAFPNLQIFALTKEVDPYTAISAGLEQALGDDVVVYDPLTDDLQMLPVMLSEIQKGKDVVFAVNQAKPKLPFLYQGLQNMFYLVYKWCVGVYLPREAPGYRILSRKVVQFILKHPHPAVGYRHLPATSGFSRTTLRFSFPFIPKARPGLLKQAEVGFRMIFSSTAAPMRLVSLLSLFGAGVNLLYSMYVLMVAIFNAHVAPGWVSTSMQLSGMFFLLSLVQFVLGEYMAQILNATTGGPPYHIAQEFSSIRIQRRDKLNISESQIDKAQAAGASVHVS